ncbi:MAG: hypothetical protein QM605_15570 [Sphingobium sp.]
MKLAAVTLFVLGGMMLIIRMNPRLRPRFWPNGISRIHAVIGRTFGLLSLAAAVYAALSAYGIAIGLVLSLTMIMVMAALLAFGMNLYRPHPCAAPALIVLAALMICLS